MVFGGEAITLGHWLGMALGAVLGIGGFWAARKAIDFAVHVRPYAPLSLRDMTDDEEGEAEHFAEVEYGPVVPCEGTFVPTRGIRTEYRYEEHPYQCSVPITPCDEEDLRKLSKDMGEI